MNSFLRWVTVLPGAIAGGLLATFPLHWILGLIFPNDGASLLDFMYFNSKINVSAIELVLSPLVIAAFYVWIGSEIAPNRKLVVALVLSAFYLFFLGYLFFASAGQAVFDIKTAGAVFGLLLGLLIVWLRIREAESNLVSQKLGT